MMQEQIKIRMTPSLLSLLLLLLGENEKERMSKAVVERCQRCKIHVDNRLFFLLSLMLAMLDLTLVCFANNTILSHGEYILSELNPFSSRYTFKHNNTRSMPTHPIFQASPVFRPPPTHPPSAHPLPTTLNKNTTKMIRTMTSHQF